MFKTLQLYMKIFFFFYIHLCKLYKQIVDDYDE